MTSEYRRVGRIRRPHGARGEVVVSLAEGIPAEVLPGLQVWVVPPLMHARPMTIESARRAPKGVIVALSGFGDLQGAHDLSGKWLLAEADDLPELPSVAPDLRGYTVIDARRGTIGLVREVIVTGANDVLVVDEGPYGEVLVPVIDDVVRDVDDSQRTIAVVLLDGLIEESGAS